MQKRVLWQVKSLSNYTIFLRAHFLDIFISLLGRDHGVLRNECPGKKKTHFGSLLPAQRMEGRDRGKATREIRQSDLALLQAGNPRMRGLAQPGRKQHLRLLRTNQIHRAASNTRILG